MQGVSADLDDLGCAGQAEIDVLGAWITRMVRVSCLPWPVPRSTAAVFRSDQGRAVTRVWIRAGSP